MAAPPFRKVTAGSRLAISALAHNATIDAVKAGQASRFDGGAGIGGTLPDGCIYARNDSGSDVGIFSVLRIDDLVIRTPGTGTDDLATDAGGAFLASPLVSCVAASTIPLQAASYGITQEPIKSGSIGVLRVSGISYAFVTMRYPMEFAPYVRINNGGALVQTPGRQRIELVAVNKYSAPFTYGGHTDMALVNLSNGQRRNWGRYGTQKALTADTPWTVPDGVYSALVLATAKGGDAGGGHGGGGAASVRGVFPMVPGETIEWKRVGTSCEFHTYEPPRNAQVRRFALFDGTAGTSTSDGNGGAYQDDVYMEGTSGNRDLDIEMFHGTSGGLLVGGKSIVRVVTANSYGDGAGSGIGNTHACVIWY
jgi:hypothetical protein